MFYEIYTMTLGMYIHIYYLYQEILQVAFSIFCLCGLGNITAILPVSPLRYKPGREMRSWIPPVRAPGLAIVGF